MIRSRISAGPDSDERLVPKKVKKPAPFFQRL